MSNIIADDGCESDPPKACYYYHDSSDCAWGLFGALSRACAYFLGWEAENAFSFGITGSLTMSGFRTNSFSPLIHQVFLDPNDIKPEQIANFIAQLSLVLFPETDGQVVDLEKITDRLQNLSVAIFSLSVPNMLALSKLAEDATKFEEFTKAYRILNPKADETEETKNANNICSIIRTIAKRARYNNPPGILYINLATS